MRKKRVSSVAEVSAKLVEGRVERTFALKPLRPRRDARGGLLIDEMVIDFPLPSPIFRVTHRSVDGGVTWKESDRRIVGHALEDRT